MPDLGLYGVGVTECGRGRDYVWQDFALRSSRFGLQALHPCNL